MNCALNEDSDQPAGPQLFAKIISRGQTKRPPVVVKTEFLLHISFWSIIGKISEKGI